MIEGLTILGGLIPEFFGVGKKIWQVFSSKPPKKILAEKKVPFLKSRDFGGYSKQVKIRGRTRGSASACVSRLSSSANKVQSKLFCGWSREFLGFFRKP